MMRDMRNHQQLLEKKNRTTRTFPPTNKELSEYMNGYFHEQSYRKCADSSRDPLGVLLADAFLRNCGKLQTLVRSQLHQHNVLLRRG